VKQAVQLPPPLAFVTVTVTVPAAWAGLVALQVVVEAQLTAVAAVPPNVTVVAPKLLKPVPLIVTAVPPAVEPLGGDTLVTAGGGGGGGGGRDAA